MHGEMQNLVWQFPMPDICCYLRQMCKDSRVYLRVKHDAMFAELHRMSMPPNHYLLFLQELHDTTLTSTIRQCKNGITGAIIFCLCQKNIET